MKQIVLAMTAVAAVFALSACSRKATTWIGAPAKINAESALETALARAQIENKVVFVFLSAPG